MNDFKLMTEVKIKENLDDLSLSINVCKKALDEDFVFQLNWKAEELYVNHIKSKIFAQFLKKNIEADYNDKYKPANDEPYISLETYKHRRIIHMVNFYVRKLTNLKGDGCTNALSTLCDHWEVQAYAKVLRLLTSSFSKEELISKYYNKHDEVK